MKSIYHPRVSVLMNVYNGEKYLRETLDSILAQTFTDYEFIIVDDGSNDDTVEIIKTYHDERIKLIKNEQNCGCSFSLNRGLSTAQGDYIAHTDCDDISSPERFMTQIQYLDENPSIDIVGSWIEIIDQNSQPTGKWNRFISLPMGLRWSTFFNVPVAHSAVMMRRRIFNYGEKYDDSELASQDYGLWARLNLHIKFSNIQSALLKYRVHDAGISITQKTYQFNEACKISRQAIGSYLGKNIPLETIKLIRESYQVQSIATYKSSICMLHQLYKKFRNDYSLDPSDIAYINLDIANKINQISSKNPHFILSWLLWILAKLLVIYTLVIKLLIRLGFFPMKNLERLPSA